jgi:type IV pilus assembly protein PilW
MAGYDDPETSFAVMTPTLLGTTGSSGALVSLPNLKSGADTLALRFEGGAKIRDCLGQPITAGNEVVNQYGVRNDNTLVCGTNSGNSTPLAEGVEDLQVLYGVDTDSDRLANRYVGAAGVTDWEQVVTVQIALLVNSVSNALRAAETVCLGCTVFNGSEDLLVRAEFQTTVGIRN